MDSNLPRTQTHLFKLPSAPLPKLDRPARREDLNPALPEDHDPVFTLAFADHARNLARQAHRKI